MAGSKEAALKASATRLKKYGPNYFKSMGSLGGKASKGYKFAHGKVDPSDAGKKGAQVSAQVRGKNHD